MERGGAIMPLTEFQRRLALLLSVNRTPDSYLAGGAALHIKPNSKRFSNDLDYFHDSEDRFVQPVEGEEVQRHFGRPGGVLPIIRN